MSERLPTHVEVSALIRMTEGQGGFATVISSGDRDAGTILILTIETGGNARLWERMPNLGGTREFTVTKKQESDKTAEFEWYLARRTALDPDAWLIELAVPNAERFIATLPR